MFQPHNFTSPYSTNILNLIKLDFFIVSVSFLKILLIAKSPFRMLLLYEGVPCPPSLFHSRIFSSSEYTP